MNNQIISYYKTADLWLPKYPNFRIWKVRIDDGTIIKIPDQIRNEEILRKWLLRLCPIDVWYSSGCWINPTKVKGSQTKNYELFRDIPFDLDAEKPYGEEELEIVRLSTINLINFIKEKLDLEPKYILLSGKKGFQVIYQFFNLTEELIHQFKQCGIDYEITRDRYRVIRLPLTINNSGRLAVFLTEEDLNKGISHILNKSKQIYIPADNQGRVGKLEKADDRFSSSKVIKEERDNYPNRSSSKSIYATNEVKGTRRFIPILKYNLKNTNFNPKKEIIILAEKYGLNEWFVIRTENELYYISLASFDRRRLQKILNSTNSETKYEFRKLRKIFIRTSAINGKEDKPVSAGIIFLNKPTKQLLYSRPHADMMKYFDFEVNPLNKYIGDEKPRTLMVTKR